MIDINLLCIRQSDAEIEFDSPLFCLEKLNSSQTDSKIYPDNWFVFNAVMGSAYQVYSRKIPDATYDIVDFQKQPDVDAYMKYMLRDERLPQYSEVPDEIPCCAVFNHACIEEFENLLKELLQKSEVRTCAVLFRLQMPGSECYAGRISLRQFMSMLKERRIYLNTCYLISEQDYD